MDNTRRILKRKIFLEIGDDGVKESSYYKVKKSIKIKKLRMGYDNYVSY